MKRFLLPNFFQKAGLVLFAAGIILSWLRFGAGIKPGFLDVKVFALYSTFFETKYLKFIHNNISEEICGIVVLTGLFFIAFSREKTEKEYFPEFRLKAFMLAGYSWIIFILASFIFVFGIAFINVLSFNLILPLLLYSFYFRYFCIRDRMLSRQ